MLRFRIPIFLFRSCCSRSVVFVCLSFLLDSSACVPRRLELRKCFQFSFCFFGSICSLRLIPLWGIVRRFLSSSFAPFCEVFVPPARSFGMYYVGLEILHFFCFFFFHVLGCILHLSFIMLSFASCKVFLWMFASRRPIDFHLQSAIFFLGSAYLGKLFAWQCWLGKTAGSDCFCRFCVDGFSAPCIQDRKKISFFVECAPCLKIVLTVQCLIAHPFSTED